MIEQSEYSTISSVGFQNAIHFLFFSPDYWLLHECFFPWHLVFSQIATLDNIIKLHGLNGIDMVTIPKLMITALTILLRSRVIKPTTFSPFPMGCLISFSKLTDMKNKSQ